MTDAQLFILAFAAAGTAAAIFNGLAVYDARLDQLAVIRSHVDGVMDVAATSGVWREVRRLALQLMLVGGALLALFAQPDLEVDRARWISRAVALVFQIGLAEQAIYDRRIRRRMLRLEGASRHRR